MSKESALIISRRRILCFGTASLGSTLLAGCAGVGYAVSLAGGGGSDWTTLGNEFAGNLGKIAAQTEGLLSVQAMYAATFGLKNQAAELKAYARRAKSGDAFGAADLDEQMSLMTSTANDVAAKARADAGRLDAAQKKKLNEGQKQHAQAIRSMWGGVLGIGLVLVKTTAAGPPSLSDIALFDTFIRITQVGPKALAFGETSEATYKEYTAAFEYAGVATAPALKLESLPSLFG